MTKDFLPRFAGSPKGIGFKMSKQLITVTEGGMRSETKTNLSVDRMF